MDQYDPEACYDVWKDGRVVGRLLASSFYALRPDKSVNFNRVEGGVEGEQFFYRGRPRARLVGNEFIGDDGTVLKLARVIAPLTVHDEHE